MQTACGGLAARAGDPAVRAGAGRGSNTAGRQVATTIGGVTLEPLVGLSKSPLLWLKAELFQRS